MSREQPHFSQRYFFKEVKPSILICLGFCFSRIISNGNDLLWFSMICFLFNGSKHIIKKSFRLWQFIELNVNINNLKNFWLCWNALLSFFANDRYCCKYAGKFLFTDFASTILNKLTALLSKQKEDKFSMIRSEKNCWQSRIHKITPIICYECRKIFISNCPTLRFYISNANHSSINFFLFN